MPGILPFLIPGYSLHKELQLMSSMGFKNYDLMKMATRNAAEAMGKQNELGTIEEEKRADFLLLIENPLRDIKSLQSMESVMIRGIWISGEKRSKIISEVKNIFEN